MIDPARHRREVEAWRQLRYDALRRDTGWLTLAGLDWLKEGENAVGSDPAADVRLSAGPPLAGRLVVGPDGVVASGEFLHDGAPATGLRLASDAGGDPTMLELSSLRLCLIERGGRLAVRTWDLESPARRTFTGIDHWPVDPAWSLEAAFEPTPGRTVTVPDVLGFVEEKESPGEIVFRTDAGQHRLQALAGGANRELWIVFADATNGGETYGGGRFLYTQPPDQGSVVIDFNRAYNPPCVFSHFATCPLPWPANRLPFRVEAGERRFGIA
jgi:uncharacterized protein (DUF1684 family)